MNWLELETPHAPGSLITAGIRTRIHILRYHLLEETDAFAVATTNFDAQRLDLGVIFQTRKGLTGCDFAIPMPPVVDCTTRSADFVPRGGRQYSNQASRE